ncbi:GNAT family N-acetyltransferase [Ammoniphilus sp. CFH 90114]|uniref:GNAT family N-acetyltransferase n=1 Tax=Ammoniphilus sp. CFH 90114 TaxID=2493665 RepID=UPI00100EA6DA|nr:GNAT family N-acetyltransferase [Ammoniphilus sp. CFH 90114]RXT15225.1 GNAT family N-acetyltransferase [Ammoniphilus sp. CFH 90114]
MIPSHYSPYKWEKYSIQHLPNILYHQKELYSLNFKKMNFDDQFYQNITQWYVDGTKKQDCHSNLLYDSNGSLMGFYLFQKNESTAYLMQMFVEEKYRGQGYGHLLLNHYEEMGKELGAISSFLHASSINIQAVRFYQRNHYLIIDHETDEDNSPRYLMFKNMRKNHLR